MTDAVFTVRVVLDGDDDTDLAAHNFAQALKTECDYLKYEGLIRAFEVVREP